MIKTAAATLVIMAASAEALLGLDVNLPLGISVDLDLFGPSEDPCSECIDLWHPPHDVIIDDCDDTGNGHWHWVHPCAEPPYEEEYVWTTSTLTATHVSTIVDCGPDVHHCPGHSTVYTTVTVPGETTICPVPVTSTHGPPVVHPVPTTTVHNPPPSTHPVVHPPPVQTYVPQPPSVHVPHPSSSIWTGPVPTLTSVHVPSVHVPVHTAPLQPPPVVQPPHVQPPHVQPPHVQPPHVNPPAPVIPAPQPTHGGNTTVPVIPPPTATKPPVPTAAAGHNAQNLGLVVLAGAVAIFML